jgi:hypothetical protein
MKDVATDTDIQCFDDYTDKNTCCNSEAIGLDGWEEKVL